MRQLAPSKQNKGKRGQRLMTYLPTLRLNFHDGAFNEYRLQQNKVEFRAGDGTWRLLTESDVRLHFTFHTEVAKWLRKESANADRSGSSKHGK